MSNKLLLATLIGFSIQSGAQTYYPLLADSNVWAVYMDVMPLIEEQGNSQMENQNPSTQMFGPDYVRTTGDTVIGPYTYSRFFSRTHEGNPVQWSLLREDTATQQVFILSAGDTAERIIYDFSLSTGDSIWLEFMYQSPGELQTGWWYVDSTNTYSIAAGPRKALYLSNPMNPMHNGNQVRFIQWIESVGCNISPVYLDENTSESFSPCENSMGPGCAFNTHLYSVTCAWQDSMMTFSSECWENVRQQITFSYPNGDTCIFMLMGAVEDPSLGLNNVQLMPNPADESVRLYFESGFANEFEVVITNMLGQTMEQVPLTWYASGAHSIAIDLSGYAPGVYSVNLVGAEGRMSLMMVVQ